MPYGARVIETITPKHWAAGPSCKRRRVEAAMFHRQTWEDNSMSDVHLDRALSEEFAGRSAEIHALKASDPAFRTLLESNHKLWAEIQKIQESIAPADDAVLENLEKLRLLVLDEISSRLQAGPA
jgi:uncharacterized protein YdcH (DUF465 family)